MKPWPVAITVWLSPEIEPGEPPRTLCPENCVMKWVSWSKTQNCGDVEH